MSSPFSIKLSFLSFLFLLSSSCAQGFNINDVDAGEDGPKPCYPPAGISHDWCTSGDFGGACSPAYADGTKNGHCTCGLSDFPCGLGSNCRYGTCVEVDAEGRICEFDAEQTAEEIYGEGDCPRGNLCIEGHCTFYRCVEEECDSVDNDCDGMTDEADDRMPLRQLCLGNLPVPDVMILPCQPGRRECLYGTWTECLDDIAPRPEQGLLACDGVDNDCDACIDGVLQNDRTCSHQEPGTFDVVFIMDISGSMRLTINEVVIAVNNFAANFINNPTFKFGIVLISKWGMIGGQGSLYLDLTDFNTFAVSLAAMPLDGGGEEPQWDTIYELATGELPVSWTTDATRILVLFTDEDGQTTRVQRGLDPKTEADMCASLQHGEVLASFTEPYYAPDFDDCGVRFDITDAATMEMNLSTQVLINPCL